MRVFVQEDPIVPLVSLRAVVLGGQRYESDADNGINTLLSRTVTRGTRTRSGEEVAREIESMAGHMEAFAGRNSFGFALDILSRHFDRGLATLVECMLEPALAEDVVGRERDVLLEDIRARDDNPSGLAFDLFSSHLFRRHPYRLPGLGTEMSVRVLTRDPLVRYYRRYCRPASMVVAVVGDVRAEDVFARLTRVFSGQPATPTRPPRIQSEPPLEGIREAVLAREKEQAHFVLGFPGIALTDRDRPAMQLLSAVLGGQGGRLFVELRDRQSLAYSVGAFSYEGVEPGYFAVYMAGAPEKRDQAVRGMLAELEKVAAQGVGEDELARARLYIVGSHDISLQRPASRATTIAFNELYGLGWREMIDLPRRVTSVKASDVRRVARRYLTVGREARYVLAQVMPAPAMPATT
jgi:zinc protease